MDRLKGLKKPLYLVSLPNFFLGLVLPIYALKLGSNAVEIGMLFSVFSLFSIFMRPLVGRWIDKRGRKNGVIIGMAAYAFTRLLFLVGETYVFLFIARIFQSIAASFMYISLDAMVSDVSNINDRSTNFGMISQQGNRGGFIGSFIGFTILFCHSDNNPFKLIFAIYFIASILALYFSSKDIKETLTEGRKETKAKVLINKTFIKYLIIIGILALANEITTPIFVIYLKDHITKDLSLISFMFIPGGILSMYLPSKLGKLADNFGRKKLMIGGLILEAVFTFSIPFTRDYYSFIILYTLITASGMMSVPAQRALVSEITGDSNRGRSYGLYHLIVGLGGIIGPLIGGSIYQYINKDIVFFIEAAGLLIAIVCIGFFIKIDNRVSGRDILKI